MASSLRPSLMIATICHEHGIPALAENADFRDTCADILLTRTKDNLPEATRRLWDLFNQFIVSQTKLVEQLSQPATRPTARLHGEEEEEFSPSVALDSSVRALASDAPILAGDALPEDIVESDDGQAANVSDTETLGVDEPQPVADFTEVEGNLSEADTAAVTAATEPTPDPQDGPELDEDTLETRIFDYLDANGAVRLVEIERTLELNRFQVVNALKSLLDQGLVKKQSSDNQPAVYSLSADEE
jgi:hypothetical protein